MGVNSLPKSVTGQRRDCDLNPGPSAPESSTLTTRLRSHRQQIAYMIAATTCDSLLRRRLSYLYETTCTCTSRCHHLTNCHCQLSVRLILQVTLIRVSIGTRLHCQQTSTPSITVDLQSNFAADWDWLSCGFRPAFHSTQNRLNSQLLQISSIYRIFQCLTTALDFLCIALFGHVKPAIIETRIWMKSLKSAESAN